MSWQLNHCFVGAPCGYGTPLVARKPKFLGRALRRGPSEVRCEKDLGLGVAESLRQLVDQHLASNGFELEPNSDGGSPWLWCLGGPEVLRQQLAKEDHHDQPGSCIDLNLYVCETHQSISAQIDHIDAVTDWGGTGPDNPRQSEPINLGSNSEAAAAAMKLLSAWFGKEIISPHETQHS